VTGLRIAVWLGGLTPLALLVYRAFTGGLGVNPVEHLTHRTGFWALTLLMVTLSITPIRRLTKRNDLIKLRRPIGLFAFFYACLHFLIFIVFDHLFALSSILEDIVKRPYITAGFTAFVLLIPLALTSTKGWIRRLGKRWQRLHRLVYLSAGLGVLHFFWKAASKADVREPLIFAGVLAILMIARLPIWLRRKRRTTSRLSDDARRRTRAATGIGP